MAQRQLVTASASLEASRGEVETSRIFSGSAAEPARQPRVSVLKKSSGCAALLFLCVRQRNHEALAHRLGVAHESLHRRVGTLPGFEFRE